MKHRKTAFIGICMQLFVALALIFMPVSAASAACNGNGSKGQVLNGVGETGGDCNGTGFTNVLSTVVTIISYIAGILAVIMVMVAAIKFMTSGGDSGKVSSAKSTLVYAMIGIAIAALAQVIVHFVINSAIGATGTSS